MLPPDGSIHAFALAPAGTFSNFPPGESQSHWLLPGRKFENALLPTEREHMCFPCPMYAPTLAEVSALRDISDRSHDSEGIQMWDSYVHELMVRNDNKPP